MRFRSVLFDLDGTLIDHLPAIHRAYSHTLPRLGLPAPTLEQVRRAIGGGLENAMRNFVPEDRLAEGLAIYRPYWDRTMLEGAVVMPGGRELLAALTARGVTCAVFTNKHGPSARAVCEHLGLSPWLRLIVGATDTPWLKPQPEFADDTLRRLRELGVPAEDTKPAATCLVGDSPWDVQAAHTAGFPCFAVTTGTHSAEELRQAGADGVFAGLADVGREALGLDRSLRSHKTKLADETASA
ncbi:HAD family hydrolase [Geminisphaera colitermitum]|uniref:HAD family hydrolase n=1 Tax=Geminisphaera colitermitum TaxID=1148786 RepID=UPI000158D64C|nr:HAD family hydrolase [Geminisphaera colitermitum]